MKLKIIMKIIIKLLSFMVNGVVVIFNFGVALNFFFFSPMFVVFGIKLTNGNNEKWLEYNLVQSIFSKNKDLLNKSKFSVL